MDGENENMNGTQNVVLVVEAKTAIKTLHVNLYFTYTYTHAWNANGVKTYSPEHAL